MNDELRRQTTLARFSAKYTVDESTGCWVWSGAINPGGYGLFRVGRHSLAHRWSYEYFVGPIPDGLVIDHLCRNRACANPAHLEPVTLLENVRRGVVIKTHCKNGHPYDEVNTRIAPAGSRQCRTCSRERTSRYLRRKAAA